MSDGVDWKSRAEKAEAMLMSMPVHSGIAALTKENIDLRVENKHLRTVLQEIEAWSRAYPLKAFPKPDLVKAQTLLAAGGMTLDAISADAMRHVVDGVGEIARCALEDGK